MTLYPHTHLSHLKFLLIPILMFVSLNFVLAQQAKKMTPDVYSQWNKIKQIQMSDSAEVIIYSLEKEIGDKKMGIYTSIDDMTTYVDRVNKHYTDVEGKYILYSRSLSYDSLRSLKRKKTEKDKLPKDSLCIYNLATKTTTVIDNIEDFKVPEKYSGYCFYTKKLKSKPASIIKDSISLDTIIIIDTLTKKTQKVKKVCDSLALIIRHLDSGREDTIIQVKDYVFAEENPKLAYCQCSGDSLASYSVFTKDLTTDSLFKLNQDMFQITQMSFDKKGKHFAFLGLEQKSEAKQKPFKLYLDKAINQASNLPVDTIKPQDWVISEHKPITWSESGKRLFFGIAPILPIKDTTLLEDESVQVEIWYHDSPRLYTQMEANIENDRKKSYAIMYDLDSLRFTSLESLDADRSIISAKGDGRYFLQMNAKPYLKEMTWLGDYRKDFVLIDTKTNQTSLILAGDYGDPTFSPTGRYLYWWSRADSIWKTFDTQKSIFGVLGLWSVATFQNEENDIPQKADPYGIAGWLPQDSAAVLYDRYDLWQLNPNDPFAVRQLTNGRLQHQVHRWIKTDPDDDFMYTDQAWLIKRFDENTKGSSYVHLYADSLKTKLLTGGNDVMLTTQVKKPRKNSKYLFTSENFNTFPDLLLANADFSDIKKITNANPQQAEYGWGKAQLMAWTNYDNQKNEGMVFYPPQFDPEKKYPLIVNFYERSSDELHRHRAPEAHRSSINYTYYTNLGYIIFNPDIKYKTGQPGDDCYNAVESGVDALVKTGYIDETRIALQGHSWGGYQVAYLLTKSERYRCAESGAPVVNMVSAYGGIRWESGMSRMFQYEKTQSRLGATLWENPERFHHNSPIYNMPKVTTPVLILHNDEDGAVPWYQGIEYFMALRRLGKPAWLLNYNSEPHWPVKWQNRLDFNIRMEQFFNHYLMDGPLPLWMKEGNNPVEKGILKKY